MRKKELKMMKVFFFSFFLFPFLFSFFFSENDNDNDGDLSRKNFPKKKKKQIRDCAAGRPGPVTRVGLGTFVDPRQRAKATTTSSDDPSSSSSSSYPVRVVVEPNSGEELLHYLAPESIDVALLRGTVADADGNVGFSREALLGDSLNQAIAAHNSWHRKQGKKRGGSGGSRGGAAAPLRVSFEEKL